MKKILTNSRMRRVISSLLIITLLFCTTVTDVNLFFGLIHIDLSHEAEAATGTIDASTKLTSSIVPDNVLLEYLKNQVVAADSSIAKEDVTVGNLVNKVKSALVIPSNVSDITGLGWARGATGIDMSQCSGVSEIPISEFESCNMTQVVLPSSLVKINSNAFKNCKKLETINLGSVTYIGDSAFSFCEALTDSSIQSMNATLTYLGLSVFDNCTSLTEVIIPKLTDIEVAGCVPTSLFKNCSKLEKVKFADTSLNKIKDSAFEGTGALTFTTGTVYGNTLPSTVEYIGNNAFYKSGIASLDLSSNISLTEIRDNTFIEANLSSGITLPESLTKIGSSAFEKTKITKIVIPNKVTELGKACFKGTSNLAKAVLSKSIKVIPEAAFQGSGFGGAITNSNGVEYSGSGVDTNLEISFNGVTPEESLLEKIGSNAFNCSSVSDDTFLSGLTKLTEIGDNAFSFADFSTLTIPACVETLGKEAFQANWYLTEVTFAGGSKVKEFPMGLFGGSITATGAPNAVNGKVLYPCINLTKITFPENLEKIGRGCFSYCVSLKTGGTEEKMVTNEVNFPNTLLVIDEYAFSHCAVWATNSNPKLGAYPFYSNFGIEKIVVPDSVTTIGKNAFEENKFLNTLVIGKGVTEIPDKMCYNCGAYPIDTANNKEIKEESRLIANGEVVTSSPEYTSDNYTPLEFDGLKDLTLPDTIEKIGTSAFDGCFALDFESTYGALPANLMEIGANAFQKCKSLTEIEFGSKLTKIGNNAFNEASQFISEKIGNTTIKHQYYGLTDVDFTFATSLSSIGSNAFANTNITSIIFPEGVTELPGNVCLNSYNLKTVETGNALTKVGSYAFKDCYKLSSVTIPYSAELAKDAFSGYAANETQLLTVKPKVAKETADVIIGRDNELELKCLKNFATTNTTYVEFTITDGQKDSNNNLYNLLKDDVNAKVKASVNKNLINFYGKELGKTSVSVASRVDLYEQKLNAGQVSFSIAYDYDLNVTQLPIDSLELSANTMEQVASEQVVYVDFGNTTGVTVNGTYEPGNTTDILSWSIEDESVATITELTSTGNDEKKIARVQLKPVALGDTRLTLSSPSKTVSCIVKVRVPVSNVQVNTSTSSSNPLLLANDSNYQLSTVVNYASQYKDTPDNLKDTCIYVSTDESVVTVNRDTGYITSVGNGTAQIQIKSLATGRVLSNVYVSVQDEAALTSMKMTATGMIEEGGTNVMYMSLADTAGKTFAAEYTPQKTTDNIIWSTDHDGVVSLSATSPTMNNGKSSLNIKPVGAGDTVVRAKSKGLEESCIIRVRVPASGLSFGKSSVTVATGSIYPLVTTIKYSTAYQAMAASYPDSCTYSSNNTAVATVDPATGVIHAVGQGTAKITAKCLVSNRTATFTITVKDGYTPPITTFKLSQTSMTVDVGKQATLTVDIQPAGAKKDVTWTSSDPKIATVNGGIVKGIKTGSVTITATGDGNKKASCSVTVKSPAKGLKIKASTGDTKKVYMKKGTTLTLGKYFTNADCTDTFKFTTKKNKFGTVTESGVVTAKKPGKFTVNITSYSGTVKKATSKITVYVSKKEVKAKRVKISGSKSVKVGKAICLTAKFSPSKATTAVTWRSNKPALATVDSYGVVKGVKKGKVVITATTSNGKKKTIKITVKK